MVSIDCDLVERDCLIEEIDSGHDWEKGSRCESKDVESACGGVKWI